MKWFIKSDAIDGKSTKILLGLDIEKPKETYLSPEKMQVGWKNTRFLAKLSVFDQKREKEKMLDFYIATTK